MRLLITGAAGFIGSHLAEQLMSQGHSVVGVDAFRPHYDRTQRETNVTKLANEARFTFHELDLVSDEISPLLDGCDAIFHLAGRPGVRDSFGTSFGVYVDDNILATQRLLESMVAVRVPRVVYASSSSVYGELGSRVAARESDRCQPLSPYGVTKLAAENLCFAYQDNFGLECVALRYFTIYGPRQRPDMAIQKFIEKGELGEPIQIYGDGSQTRDLTFVGDCVSATVSGLELEPGIYNVAGGGMVSLNQILEMIEDSLGFDLRRTYEPSVPGDVTTTSADTSKLRATGFVPEVTADVGISEQVSFSRGKQTDRVFAP